ncbi:DUF697 domain-containing protein [bacterium]|nr:DUF697 domain-containing protein [bacterium]
MVSLPAPVQELWNVWREIEGKAGQPMTLGLVAAPGPERDHWRDALLIGSHDADRLVLIDADDQRPAAADLYLGLVTTSSSAIAREMPALTRLDASKLAIALVGIPDHLAATRQRELIHALSLEAEQVVPVASLKELAGPFARVLFDRFPELVIPLSRQFPIFRSEAAWQEIQATAKQNGVVGVIPIPGADMPLMTANQIKMVLRMAAMFDMPLGVDRARELLAVVGGGFGLRTAARQIAKFIPGPGWLLGGAIGYSGTLAMGKAALEYFRRSAPSHQVPVSRAIITVTDEHMTGSEGPV